MGDSPIAIRRRLGSLRDRNLEGLLCSIRDALCYAAVDRDHGETVEDVDLVRHVEMQHMRVALEQSGHQAIKRHAVSTVDNPGVEHGKRGGGQLRRKKTSAILNAADKQVPAPKGFQLSVCHPLYYSRQSTRCFSAFRQFHRVPIYNAISFEDEKFAYSGQPRSLKNSLNESDFPSAFNRYQISPPPALKG